MTAALVAPLAAQQAATDTARATSPVAMSAMVVTAARRAESEASAAMATTVITRDDIRATAASDVAAVLMARAGIQPAAGTPAGAGVLLQGLGDQRVLILLDGEPLVGRIGGGFDLSRIPSSIVERIEIVQGPQSLFYGSDALGGVVNIITRDPRLLSSPLGRLAVESEVIGGSHERLDLTSRISRTLGPVALSVLGGRRAQALAPGIAFDAGARADRWDVAPRAIWMHGEALTVDAGGAAIFERQRYRTGQLFTFSDNTQYAANASAKWEAPGRTLSSTLSMSSFDHLSRASSTSQPASDSGARDIQRVVRADVGFSVARDAIAIDGGTEFRHEWTSADRIAGGARAVDGAAIFGQAAWTVQSLSIVPGARLSWSETWGTVATPRLALVLHPDVGTGTVTVRASGSSGFRAPDFKELYLDFVNAAAGYAVQGNPALSPERSINFSGSADWRVAAAFVRLSGFHNRFRDFIETVGPDGSGVFTYANVARGSTAGVDAEATQRIGMLTAGAGYGFLHTHNDEVDGALLGRASHSGRVSLSVAPRRLRSTSSLSVVHTGSAPSARDQSGAISAYRPALTQVNARVGRSLGSLTSTGELYVAADNLLDATAGQSWPGFTGRRLSAGLSWTFR